jgi:hypothetical protein
MLHANDEGALAQPEMRAHQSLPLPSCVSWCWAGKVFEGVVAFGGFVETDFG